MNRFSISFFFFFFKSKSETCKPNKWRRAYNFPTLSFFKRFIINTIFMRESLGTSSSNRIIIQWPSVFVQHLYINSVKVKKTISLRRITKTERSNFLPHFYKSFFVQLFYVSFEQKFVVFFFLIQFFLCRNVSTGCNVDENNNTFNFLN